MHKPLPKRAKPLVWAAWGAVIFMLFQTMAPGPWGGRGLRFLIIGTIAQGVGGFIVGAACAGIRNWMLGIGPAKPR
jgi:hypothetical protein